MSPRPLLVTSDPTLLDALLGLAAVAGVETDVAADVGSARRAWGSAPLVLVGGDLVDDLAGTRLPRRAGLLLVPAVNAAAPAWARAPEVGAESVQPLPGAEPLLVERLAAAATPTRGATVVVIGGRGGAGASTLACALARVGARDGTALLVDADPLGGGLDLMLGAEDVPGLRWPELAATSGRAGAHELRAALPAIDGVTVVAWHRGEPLGLPAAAMESVLGAGRRGHDLVVVDLPRGLDAAGRVAASTADLGLVVVPAEVRAVAAAAAVVARLSAQVCDLRVVVRGPAPAGLTARMVADELALPLAGWLAPEPGLAGRLERGEPPGRSPRGPLTRLCRDVLSELTARIHQAA